MSLRITSDTLTPGLEALDGVLKGGIMTGMDYGATLAEQQARTNAPWTDRTGNARNGLFAVAVDEDPTFLLVLYHTMPYGVYLEAAHSGRFAIIMPTLEAIRSAVLTAVSAAMARAVQIGR